MDNIGLMSETVNFIQGSKRNYDSSTMQGGVYFSKDSKEIFLNGESYGNAVPADEEDLTSVNGALQLKDREVNSDNFQSKGYVILRKNLVQQEDGSYKNILTGSMFKYPNTTYEIRYDFELNNWCRVPKNTSIYFNGGSFKGTGKLIGQKINDEKNEQIHYIGNINYTNIPLIDISNSNINSNINVVDFGIDNTGIKDVTEDINNLFSALYTSSYSSISNMTIYFPKGNYLISGPIQSPWYNLNLVGEDKANTIINVDTTNLRDVSIFPATSSRAFSFKNIQILGNSYKITTTSKPADGWWNGLTQMEQVQILL